jgi:hypothetical protein
MDGTGDAQVLVHDVWCMMVVGRDVGAHPISIGRDHLSARRLLFGCG